MDHLSWGLYPRPTGQSYLDLSSRFNPLPISKTTLLPRGLGRSYGDSCLNSNGLLAGTKELNHFISFNQQTGLLTCEAGTSFCEILRFIVPKKWFLPVTPGTKFITVGGAIANDVHGKNHHTSGNFSRHVTQFELLRSNGERFICSRSQNSDLFHSTVGGLGLTGLITWAQFQCKPIDSAWIDQEQIQFHSIGEFIDLSRRSEEEFEYCVSWVDCQNPKGNIRGILIRGQHSPAIESSNNLICHSDSRLKNIPTFMPEILLNKYSMRLFNEVYFRKNLSPKKSAKIHYEPFFYPLDSVQNWNRIYGKRGFLQYQFVIPFSSDNGEALKKIFAKIAKSQMGSFLAVLKIFGSLPSEGLLSFPRKGVTLALDFPNYGAQLLKLLEDCDQIVKSVGGSVYPAKDARMSSESFKVFYPQLKKFEEFVDPKFCSDFWRRVR